MRKLPEIFELAKVWPSDYLAFLAHTSALYSHHNGRVSFDWRNLSEIIAARERIRQPRLLPTIN